MQARKLLFWAGSDGVFISFGYFIAYAGVRVDNYLGYVGFNQLVPEGAVISYCQG